MAFNIGDRVRMKRTENGGTVTRLLPGDLVQVKLDGGLGHLPIPAEALEAETSAKSRAEQEPPPAPTADAVVSKANLHEGHGVQLAFDPQLNNEAEPVAFEVYLLNSTGAKIIYELNVYTGQTRRWTKSGLLDPTSKKRLDAVEFRWLNEKLQVTVDARVVEAGGTGPRHFEKLRIKPAQFFASYVDVPQLYRDAHLYSVFGELRKTGVPDPAAAPPTPSLRELTRREAAKRTGRATRKPPPTNEVAERAAFPEKLDLHLAQLVDDPDEVPKHLVLQYQIKAFEQYLDEAVRLGVDSVWIVHGVGNGVLKRAIHRQLHRKQFIRDFKNEYHPKYGFGATEILFD